jgi:hypothetical protein
MLSKYLRVSKSPEEKEWHLRKLAGVINTPHWQEVKDEMEDSLIKVYEKIDECDSYESFIRVQSEALAIKKLANLNGLMKIVASRRHRFRPPDNIGQKTKE